METSYNMFAGILKTLYDTHCPINNTRLKRLDVSKPIITPEIKCMLKLKHKLQKNIIKKQLPTAVNIDGWEMISIHALEQLSDSTINLNLTMIRVIRTHGEFLIIF